MKSEERQGDREREEGEGRRGREGDRKTGEERGRKREKGLTEKSEWKTDAMRVRGNVENEQ